MHPLDHRCSVLLSCIHQATWRSRVCHSVAGQKLTTKIVMNNFAPQKLPGRFSPNEEWRSFKGTQDPGAMGSWLKTAGLWPVVSWFSISIMSFFRSFSSTHSKWQQAKVLTGQLLSCHHVRIPKWWKKTHEISEDGFVPLENCRSDRIRPHHIMW